jgi:adenylosuccinate lyase
MATRGPIFRRDVPLGDDRPGLGSVSCVSVSIPNVLANRYASVDMVGIWAPEARVIAERRLWLAVLRAQVELGVPVPHDVIADYERVLDDVDLSSIAARERTLRHDVKARIEEFNALAGHEHVHKGMTSRDLTENVEQLQIRRSLELVFFHGVALVARLAERAVAYRDLVMAGRRPPRWASGSHRRHRRRWSP